MLHILSSKNSGALKKKFEEITNSASIVRMDVFSFDAESITHRLESTSLFGETNEVFVFNELSEDEAVFQKFLELSSSMVNSQKIFVLEESSLSKKILDDLKKSGASITEAKDTGADSFIRSNFALADAFGEKSAKSAWVEFQRSLAEGQEEEMVFGSVVGKVRDMLYTTKLKKPEGAMHPFVYNKSKSHIKNWKIEELERVYDRLLDLHYKSRKGEEGIVGGLEKIILSI